MCGGAIAGITPEFATYGARGRGWYLDEAERTTKLMIGSTKKGAPCAAADGSLEQLLRRAVDVEHHDVVLMHERTNGGIREVRKIKGTLKNMKGRGGASCIRCNRPRRRRSSGGLREVA